MSDNEKSTNSNDNSIYYILGGVVLVAAVAGFFLLKPKTPAMTEPAAQQAAQPAVPAISPTPAPITEFACVQQYYNPKVGFTEYYLSAEGVDKTASGTVTCDYEITVKDVVVKNASVTAEMQPAPERGGGTFRCITEPLALTKGIPTDVKVTMKNASNQTTECTQTFVLP